jgi:hypothetical protein
LKDNNNPKLEVSEFLSRSFVILDEVASLDCHLHPLSTSSTHDRIHLKVPKRAGKARHNCQTHVLLPVSSQELGIPRWILYFSSAEPNMQVLQSPSLQYRVRSVEQSTRTRKSMEFDNDSNDDKARVYMHTSHTSVAADKRMVPFWSKD